MAQRGEEPTPPAAEEPPRAWPGPEEPRESIVFQKVPEGSAAPPLASGEGGVIESIQLENFMCQARLGPIRFGSNVNFVVGQEGREELLTALLLALGGTTLGSSLTKFVKAGAALADISVTLRNRGQAAFKADLYGDSITVQHRISVDGTASYRLKDQAGRLVSCQKEELTALLDHFKIRVDNPMSVLQQEMGGQLLRTTDDGDRYRFFLKVTQLEQMNNDYLGALEKKTHTQKQIEQGEGQLQELKRQAVEIKEYFQSMASSRKRVEELKLELAWALVNESERQIQVMLSNITLGDQDTTRLNQKLEACQVKFNEASKKFSDMQEKLQQLTKEAAELETRCIQAKEDVNRKEMVYKQAEILYHSSQDEFKGLDRIKEQFDQTQALMRNMERGQLEKQEKIFTLREKVKDFKDQQALLTREMGYMRDVVEKDQKTHFRLREEVSDMQWTLNEEQQQLSRLKDCKSDPLKRFEPQVTALLKAVDDACTQGQFTSKPIGPLGAYIRLRDPEFALAIETCLNGLLAAFCCDNHKDEQVLQRLMKKVYPPGSTQPQIIVSAFRSEVHDVTGRAAVHPEFPTVLASLEIADAVVANALIDVRGIESVLLIKSSSLARRVMQAQRPPKNCSEAFTAEGDQVFERRYYSCEKVRPTFLIDVGVEISHLEKEIENTTAQLSVYQQHVCALEEDIKKNQETIEHYHLRLREMMTTETKIIIQIRDLENEAKQSMDISFLEKEAQNVQKQIHQVEEKMKTQTEEMKNSEKEKLDAEQRHENIKVQMGQVSELTQSVKRELEQVSSEMDVEKGYMRHYQDRLNQHLNSLKVKKEELTVKERDLETETAQAKYICPERKEITTAPSVLDREINLLKQKIKAEDDARGSREDIIRQYQEVKERYQGLDGQVKNLKECFKSLDQTSTQRYEMYQQFRTNLALRCKVYFDNLLSQWPYSGEMNFDHKNETLSIRVQPKDGNEAAFGDMQFLSFSNFFFILTLWSITESPFRCLDTLDSHMDSDSRRIAMDMIVRIAHSQQCQQFILLTPQNVSFLPPSPLTRIHLLPDAERSQSTLPFQPVTQEEEA